MKTTVFCPLLGRNCIKEMCMFWRRFGLDTNPPHGIWESYYDCGLAKGKKEVLTKNEEG